MPARKLPVVGVMGSGTTAEPHLAGPLGTWLASQDCHLLCGGGGGVMSEVARAFVEAAPAHGRQGLVIGVLPGTFPEDTVVPRGAPIPPPGYPNPYVELPIFTHLPSRGGEGHGAHSRNHINVLSSDVIVALPGGPGTASEVQLAMEYGKPVVLLTGK
uniref:Rossmann fold nucleotide-binding protein n=2 Tax=Tetraselmis sp. GSL018 TaxID=582737 RepID=A0A061REV6_9CHLO